MTGPANRRGSALCLLPLLIVAVGLAAEAHRERERRLRHEVLLTTHHLAAVLDRELAAVTTALQVLAGGRALAEDDLATLHRQAQDLVQAQIVNNVVLLDRGGQQRLNTLKPWGSELPKAGSPPALQAIFATRHPVVTDLFTGPVTGTPLVALGVPVLRGDQVIYSLNVGISPDRIGQVLNRQELPEGWIAVVVDGQGNVVARTRDATRYVGRPAAPALLERLRQPAREGTVDLTTLEGIAVIGAYSRSQQSHWSVAVGAPSAALRREALPAAAWIAVALAASAALAWRFGRRAA